MQIFERILSKEEINNRFLIAINAVLANKLISSKAGLAESLGVKPAKFSEILNGRMKVGVDMIAILCDFYKVSPDWLLMSRGNNVFRPSSTMLKIWVDDEDLNSNPIEASELNQVDASNDSATSVFLSMIKEKDKTICEQAEEIGRLRERINQLEREKGKDASGARTSGVANVG